MAFNLSQICAHQIDRPPAAPTSPRPWNFNENFMFHAKGCDRSSQDTFNEGGMLNILFHPLFQFAG
jgi:hypothetical protein